MSETKEKKEAEVILALKGNVVGIREGVRKIYYCQVRDGYHTVETETPGLDCPLSSSIKTQDLETIASVLYVMVGTERKTLLEVLNENDIFQEPPVIH